MKKITALILAVAMALACMTAVAEEPAPVIAAEAPAAAQTVNVAVSIDKDELWNFGTTLGMTDKLAGIEPVADLLNRLNIRIVTDNGGVQIDLGLDGTDVVSFAGGGTEDGLVIGSSLIPSYLLGISAEQITALMQQMMPAAGGEGQGTGIDMNALGEKVGQYAAEFSAVLPEAVKPGETETGSWEFDGVTFDTKTAQDIDEKALAEAFKKLMNDLLTDETVKGALATVPGFDAEGLLKSLDETLAEDKLPEVTVDIYGRSDGTGSYTVAEMTDRGAEAPALTYTRLQKDMEATKMTLNIAQSGANMVLTIGADGGLFEATQGELYFGFALKAGGEGLSLTALSAPDKAAATLTITPAAGGERTLSLDPEGKTVVKLEELMGGNSEALQGLAQEAQTSLTSLMQNPDIMKLITAFSVPQASAPEAEVNP